jgi:hypothetical protein
MRLFSSFHADQNHHENQRQNENQNFEANTAAMMMHSTLLDLDAMLKEEDVAFRQAMSLSSEIPAPQPPRLLSISNCSASSTSSPTSSDVCWRR